ncbi:MAG: cation:proton antiporter, partial [Nanoarchaeota archaeon]
KKRYKMESIFIQLAFILVVAFIVSYIIKTFNQPLIVGYILAGIIISPFIIKAGASNEIIKLFSEFGIAFLLFMVGLHLNPKVIKRVGLPSIFIASGQMIFSFIIGFTISIFLFNFGKITSIYIGLSLMFGSIIIIMKLLTDKGDLDTLYGKMAMGIIIIEDLVAIICLIIISSFADGTTLLAIATERFISGMGLIFFSFILGLFIIPLIIKRVAQSQELLFLFSLCLCFLMSALFSYFGFSIEIGALIAGVILSTSPYSVEISSKIRPLRDFFLIIFFIILGLKIQISNIPSLIGKAVILSLVVLIIKPIIIMSLSAIMGYTKRTNFLLGTTLTQISEFGLIILALGVSLNHISEEIISMITLAAIITIAISSYMITYSKDFYNKCSRLIRIFERKNIKEKKQIKKEYDVILFGYNRIGFNILKAIKKIKQKYLVIDFNPDIIDSLKKLNIPCLYGDSSDCDLLEELPLNKIKIGISTIPEFETNCLLIESIKRVNKDAVIIVRANHIKETMELYNRGADYVLTPHHLGGEYLSQLIKKVKINKKEYAKEKSKHIKMLKEKKENFKKIE